MEQRLIYTIFLKKTNLQLRCQKQQKRSFFRLNTTLIVHYKTGLNRYDYDNKSFKDKEVLISKFKFYLEFRTKDLENYPLHYQLPFLAMFVQAF